MKFFCLLFFISTSLAAEWYQHYQEIRDPKAYEYVRKGLAKAEREYGPAIIPVKGFYLRQSLPKKQPFLLTVADIYDWGRIRRQLLRSQGEAGPLDQIIWQKLSKKFRQALIFGDLRMADKWLFVDALNELVLDQKLYDRLAGVSLTKQEKKWLGKGLFHSKKPHLLNRSLITRFFPEALSPYSKNKRVQKGIQLCELIDRERGRFVIYLRRSPRDLGFYDELGHELFHLLNAEFNDWSVEGLATVFSEDLAEQEGKTWTTWLKDFKKKPHHPYAQSYEMIKEAQKAGLDLKSMQYYRRMKKTGKFAVHLSAWIKSLPKEQRKKATEIFTSYKEVFKGKDKAFELE